VKARAPERFERGRLRYERIRPDHATALELLLLDPRVYRTLDPGPPSPTAADVRANAQGKHEHWERHGFGLWLLSDAATDELVGRGGLQYTYASELEAVEVAWAIVPGRWGQGLATELARVSVAVAFDALGLSEVIAYTLPDNLASRRVMEKAGFVYQREIEHAGLRHVLYRQSARRDCPPTGLKEAHRRARC
jgi:RimJ/RimL family protein N-acetyltransferase